ncbi:MAG TPA: isoprenylcysteine carboxylmethyltransferase family protein [Terriglobales bacterium]
MIRAELLRTVAYIWVAFGAYWMGASLFKRAPETESEKNRYGRWARIACLVVTFVLLFLERRTIPPVLLIFLCLVWAAAALYFVTPAGSARSGEFPLYRALRLLVLAAVFALLFWNRTGVGWLGTSFTHSSVALAITGFVLTLAGLALALWARIYLGNYWSDKVVLRANHQLIRTGPYACMRHPIYSGVLLAVAGTALVVDQWRGVLAFAILLVNYSIKARREERILADAFSDRFDEHKRNTGFLLPRFGSRN